MRLGYLILAMSFSATAIAQIPSVSETVKTPVPGAGHSYIETNIETVNPADGSVSIRLPIPLPISRGINIPFGIGYDSSSYFHGLGTNDVVTPFAQSGWSYPVPTLSAQLSSFSAPEDNITGEGNTGVVNCNVLSDYVFQGADGNRQNLGLTLWWSANTYCAQVGAEGPISNSLAVPYGSSGSYQAITDPYYTNGENSNQVDVIDANGTDYHFGVIGNTGGTIPINGTGASIITDRNGNTMTIGTAGGPRASFFYTDSIGRTSLTVGRSTNTSPDTITVSGVSNPYTVTWATASANYPMTETYLPEPFTPSGSCTGSGTSGTVNYTNIPVVNAIQLPNGQSYKFTYDQTYGLISKITYPTGEIVSYVWGVNPKASFVRFPYYEAIPIGNGAGPTGQTYNQLAGYCDYQADMIVLKQRKVSGGSFDEQQDFSYSTTWSPTAFATWTQKQTTVITSDLIAGTQSKTIYTYGSAAPDYQPNTTATQLGQIPVEIQVQYYGTDGSLLRTKNQLWENERLLAKSQTMLDNDFLSETDWTYDSNEMVREKDDYDYSSAAVAPFIPGSTVLPSPGPLLRKTIYPSYHTFNNPNNMYYGTGATHIVDKPDSISLQDSGGTVQAGISYSYDSVYGNMLSAAKWLNSAGTATLSYQYQYDGFGNTTYITDPQGNQTQYIYSDAFSDDCSYVSPASAYLSKVVYPTTNGAAHVLSFKYHCASGLLSSSVDENSNTTSYIYNDPLNRLTETDYPDSWGKSTITYIDGATSSVESKRIAQSGTVWADNLMLYDASYNLISSSSISGETIGWNRTDTYYDGLGRVAKKTYPYQSTSATGGSSWIVTSGPGDTFLYDALNRPISVTHSDGSVASTTYSGRAVDAKDEGNGTRSVERITQSDALGRLTNVCEVTGQAQYSVSPANCGLDYGGTGFLTQYKYTGRGDLQYVYQGSETRTFSYDMTSRLLTAQNPESGTITYTYDTDTNCPTPTFAGELISKTDTGGVITCMQYDQLHRVIGKTYTGGSATAPPVTYAYDESSALGVSLTNTIGRMSSESTGGAYPTGSVFSYDALGNIIDNSQCTPQNCGSSVFPITYGPYNVLGGPSTSSDGMGNTMSYSYNTAGRLSGLTSSLNDSTHPANLIGNIHYNAFGSPISSTIGAVPLSDIRTYDVRGRLNSKWVGNAQNATRASATITISGSEQGNGPPTHATATVQVVGVENSTQSCDDAGNCNDIYDNGTVAIQIGSNTYSTSYQQGSTPQSLAASLASSLSQGPFTVTLQGATISLTSTATGNAADLAMQDASQTSNSPPFGSTPSFSTTGYGATMTGGYTESGPFDAGTVSVTVSGITNTATYGQNDTPATVANRLAAAINSGSSLVSATASGNVVTVTSVMEGTSSDYLLSATSASTAGFSAPSFSASAFPQRLANGMGNTVYALGVYYLPNGDIDWINDTANGAWMYQYDDFNRLSTAVSNTGFGCLESYDLYGNRTAQTAYQGSCLSPVYQPSLNNQYPNQLSYDLDGNVTSDGFNTYAYDAENRLAALNGGYTPPLASGGAPGGNPPHGPGGPPPTITGSGNAYIYDAEGRRVENQSSAGVVDFLYDLGGHVITEVDNRGNWNRGEVYVGGEHVATYNGGATYFSHADWLGTERVRSAVDGTIYSTWTSYPFGEGSAAPNPGPTHFTGKERDTESGLDYFGARYYASNMGRWMSPDWADKPEAVPYSSLDDPQSLNLYGYVGNNPLSRADADGHVWKWLQKVWDVISYPGIMNDPKLSSAQRDAAVKQAWADHDAAGRELVTSTIQLIGVVAEAESPMGAPPAITPGEVAIPNAAPQASAPTPTASAPDSTVPTSIPAGPSARPTAAQQSSINEMGDAHGCSTCGATSPGTKSGNWIGDHQPPTALNTSGGPQTYSPQCLQCSRQQGGQVAAAVRAAKKTETPQ